MSLPVGPFRAPFLIHKYRTEPQRLKNLAQRRPILDHSLGFHAVLVWALGAQTVGHPLVSDHPFASILQDAQDLPRAAQRALGSVIQRVALQRADSNALETKPRQLLLQSFAVCY